MRELIKEKKGNRRGPQNGEKEGIVVCRPQPATHTFFSYIIYI